MRPRHPRVLSATLATALVAGIAPILAVPAAHAALGAPAVVVTEIVADNTGADNFEYIEVHNVSDAAVDLAASGVTFAYSYDDSTDRSRDVPLTAEPLVLDAHETALLWVSYTSGSVDTSIRTIEEFRAFHKVAADVEVVRVTGQPGLANGGNRGIRVLVGGELSSWSHAPAGAFGADLAAHFALPADPGARRLDVFGVNAAPSPGSVLPEAVVRPAGPSPTPTATPGPTATPSATPTTTPPTGSTPAGAPLQVTELLPDSANVGGSDGYEFIEVFNATAAPIDFSDYAIDYLYPVEGTVSRWPAVPADVVIPARGTLVFWIKNGANDALTVADFNRQFGTALVAGASLVEISSAGMANGSARGIQVSTNTGYAVSAAFYNLDGRDDTQADKGIRYTTSEDPARQRLLDLAPATPGAVQSDQVAPAPVAVPMDTTAPTVTDRTAAEITPGADFVVDLALADDVQVRTATLELRNDVDAEPLRIPLTDAGGGVFRHTVKAVDLTGKRWYAYRVTASDGANSVTTPERRVAVAGLTDAPVRLNLAEGAFVRGATEVVASGDAYPSPLTLTIDGAAVETTPSLEGRPTFVFEATNVNYYFKNGVRIGDDVLTIFDKGTEGWETIATPVPLDYLQRGGDLTVSVWAGTKKAPEIDPDENNDDFEIRGLRLVLPDGRTLTPAGYADPTSVLRMGDSAGKLDFFDARFTVPEDAYSAVSHTWDTAARADGDAVVSASDGDETVSATVHVDNTAPVVTSRVLDGTAYRGEIVLDAQVSDAGSGVASTIARLDGREITLPFTTSSLTLAAGDHAFEVVATDAVGNSTTWTATFETYAEQPGAGLLSPAEGAEVAAGDVTLQAKVEDPQGDALDVAFLEGRRLDLADGDVAVRSGTVADAAAVERTEARTLSREQVEGLAAVDGSTADVSSSEAFPYQLFEVAVDDADAGADVRSTWSGRANAGATVVLSVQRPDGSGWDEVARHVAAADDEAFTLEGVVSVDDHRVDGVVRMLVQHSEGFAAPDRSTRDSAVEPRNAGDVPRSEYDFTLGWESDTQYYNENEMAGEPYKHQEAIHSYFLDRRDELNLQYVFHTGDIVDDYDVIPQWDRAAVQYDRLDRAGLPYGVLAGNHDVGHDVGDYTNYGTYFGEKRFADNPWYGGSYENNRGHYDLVSAGGIDFLMLYTGWLPDDASIAWMNDVLKRYPDRVAIVAQHEFILTTGGLGAIPQRVLDEVVATNPNVRMVMSGHYHDAFLRTDAFDDDGDGVDDRTVYSMLFDYQGLPEGGLGYLRLLHFDNEGERMMVRTYSPSLDRYNSDEPSLLGPADDPYAQQEFELTYDQLGIEPRERTLGTEAFSAEVLGSTEIATFSDVPSGTILSATWPVPDEGEHGWYVRSTDPYGAVDRSRVALFTVGAASVEPGEPGPGDPGTGLPGSGQPGSGLPGSGQPGAGLPGSGQPGAGLPGSGGAGASSSGSADALGGSEDRSGRTPLAVTGRDAAALLPWALGAGLLLAVGAGLAIARRRARRG
ncbi:metallophosphoesterase [Microbacterium testaceum]|uniref:Phosphoesterase n=1 Tax=Microbacterium testaceum TaxID=2033 RepID=A0A2T7WJI1_MICTE|nr:metallophosphoesterase [Microbacterium testaceum]PVE73680.1 phosphoesterase [Microbacterium testaceum]